MDYDAKQREIMLRERIKRQGSRRLPTHEEITHQKNRIERKRVAKFKQSMAWNQEGKKRNQQAWRTGHRKSLIEKLRKERCENHWKRRSLTSIGYTLYLILSLKN